MKSTCGASYFLTIVDDYSRTILIYLVAEKSEVQLRIRHFCTMVRTPFGK